MLLDEATSALDAESASRVLKNLRYLRQGSTLIMVTQRPEIAQYADRIYIMEEGQVAEEGCHDELLRRNGVYRRWVDSHRSEKEMDGER